MVKLNNIGRIWSNNYFIYIMTNYTKTTLYIGVTNDLYRRVNEHNNILINKTSFAKKYKCKYLVFWERHQCMQHAISREKQIKKWRRAKKKSLISNFNPDWSFLNDEIAN